MAAPLAPDRISTHLERAAEFFRSRDTLEGVLARRMLHTSTPKDADLADHLVRERRRRSRMDGSIGGSLVLTAQGLIDLLELGAERDHAVIVRFAGYLLMQKGHSVSLHSKDEAQALRLGLELPVARVIVNQAHCIATGGSFVNGLPFSLSMVCGTWGRNNFSDNMNYRHYLNITRVSYPIAERVPGEQEIFGGWFARHGHA